MYNIFLIGLKNVNVDNLNLQQTHFKFIEKNFNDLNFNEKCDLCIVDIDKKDKNELQKIIQKNNKIKFWAISELCTKAKVMQIYDSGFENILTYPIDENLIMNLELKFSIDEKNKINLVQTDGFKSPDILVVDDNEFNISVIKEIVSVFNANIISYTNSFACAEAIKKHEFDLIILDVMMPDLNGFEIAKLISKTECNKNVPVIFVSALKELQIKLQSYHAGSYAYIEKPFDFNTTRAIISNALNIKNLRDELFKEKVKLDKIMNFSSDEIILTDVEFNIISSNDKLSYSSMSKNFCEQITNYKNDKALEIIEEFVNSEILKTKFSFKFKINPKNPTYIYINASVSKVFNENKVLIGYICILRNITDEIQVQMQKDMFVATLTHDLKTPIRSQIQVLEMLSAGKFGILNQEQKKIIDEVTSSCRFMKHMTNNLLTKYSIDKKGVDIIKGDCSIKELISEVVEELKFLFKEKNQKVMVSFESNQDIFEIDRHAIKRVLYNLLSNASEYSKKSTNIEIKFIKEDKNIILTVKDEGMGIKEEDKKSVFCEFSSGARRFRKVGSGLGLYICKCIVNAHEGEISFKSKENEGTTFMVKLPVKEDLQAKENLLLKTD